VSVKDGLKAIADQVVADVQKEAEAIISKAENEAKENIKVAKQQADKNYQSIMNQAATKAEAERRKIASITEVEMRNRLLQTKERLVDAAFDRALLKLKEFVVTDEYHSYLLQLIGEAAKRIDRKSLLIQVNANDKAWLTRDVLNQLSKNLNCRVKIIEQTEDYIGGFKAQTADGKIIYDSTIDNKLSELKPVLRVEVAKTMFKEET
jgi:V/A-type H+-transporting ATPase subunit E